MGSLGLDRFVRQITGANVAVAGLWLGLAVITVMLLVLMRSRWGQARPLRKCVVLSLLAHLLLAAYATTVQVVFSSSTRAPEAVVRVSIADDLTIPPEVAEEEALPDKAWEPPVDPPAEELEPAEVRGDEPLDVEEPADEPPPEVQDSNRADSPDELAPQAAVPPEPDAPPAEPTELPPTLNEAPPPTEYADPEDMPESEPEQKQEEESEGLSPSLTEPVQPAPTTAATASIDNKSYAVPEAYKLRVAPDRPQLAERFGGTPQAEEAVQAALEWLADNQEPDGRWDAEAHGAGREMMVGGRDRQHAGIGSDTGMTGLALLAFLAAGHTHQDGNYQSTVAKGVQYLVNVQERDGGLGGHATTFAYMYCHAMATLALSECYGMTGDPSLREPVRRATARTLASQNRSSGGWRYYPGGDPGDTSQLGWQLMALKSAELAGIPMPDSARQGAVRFLKSVSSGRHGGLASYRPGERVSRSMTAEALACRQFLGLNPGYLANREATDYLLAGPPGEGPTNLYYWYYATLAMFHLQGTDWESWNEALQETLVASQRCEGRLAGSWDPNCVWGGYGGRVYSTALATLCLEVYYRFLPFYGHVASAPLPRR